MKLRLRNSQFFTLQWHSSRPSVVQFTPKKPYDNFQLCIIPQRHPTHCMALEAVSQATLSRTSPPKREKQSEVILDYLLFTLIHLTIPNLTLSSTSVKVGWNLSMRLNQQTRQRAGSRLVQQPPQLSVSAIPGVDFDQTDEHKTRICSFHERERWLSEQELCCATQPWDQE